MPNFIIPQNDCFDDDVEEKEQGQTWVNTSPHILCVKILQQDFEEVRTIFRDRRLNQGAHVGLEEECSNLMIIFHWQIARINIKQQEHNMW